MDFSERLTDLENHKTQTDYEDNLILKTMFFKIFNHYGALLFTAILKGPLLGTCETSCISDVKQLLYAIFIIRFIKSMYEIFRPFLRLQFLYCIGRKPNGEIFILEQEEFQALESGKCYLVFVFELTYTYTYA